MVERCQLSEATESLYTASMTKKNKINEEAGFWGSLSLKMHMQWGLCYFFLILKKGDLWFWVYYAKPGFLYHISVGFIALYLLAKQTLEYLPYPWHDVSKTYKSNEKLQIRLKVVFADEDAICFQ